MFENFKCETVTSSFKKCFLYSLAQNVVNKCEILYKKNNAYQSQDDLFMQDKLNLYCSSTLKSASSSDMKCYHIISIDNCESSVRFLKRVQLGIFTLKEKCMIHRQAQRLIELFLF